MLRWALLFFIVSIIAAFFGFGRISASSAEVAKVLFYIFLAFAAVSLLAGIVRKE
jgi:uncharacterized membrane protein YtjA (UPF0391 family)